MLMSIQIVRGGRLNTGRSNRTVCPRNPPAALEIPDARGIRINYS